jgi:hypothetical protein
LLPVLCKSFSNGKSKDISDNPAMGGKIRRRVGGGIV